MGLHLAALAALFGDVELAPTYDIEMRGREGERRIKLLESEIAQLKRENNRLAELNSRMDALLLSTDSSYQKPPATGSN